MELTVRVHEEDGGYWAEVAQLPGCLATGDTLDELREALEEAVSLYLHDTPDGGTLRDLGPTDSRHLQVDEIKVTA